MSKLTFKRDGRIMLEDGFGSPIGQIDQFYGVSKDVDPNAPEVEKKNHWRVGIYVDWGNKMPVKSFRTLREAKAAARDALEQ
jgi:hypothetical protein